MEAVLNWLWQGVVLAIATAAILRVLKPSRTEARYRALWVALLSVLILPGIPLVWDAVSSTRGAGDIPVTATTIVSIPMSWWPSGAVVIGLWAAWSTVYAYRIAIAALALRRAKRHCQQIPAEIEAQLLYWTRLKTTGRHTHLVLSRSVRSAAVLGCAPPVIAVAPALLHHLSDDELDRVVIHEWAHVQRRDDLANIVQLLVRVTAGWHPAVWWFDRRLHIEREVACDEMTVTVTGSAKRYAACLAKLATLPALPLRPIAVGALSSGGLRERIARMLSPADVASTRSQRAVSVGAGLSLCALALTVGGLRFIEATAPLTYAARTALSASADATAIRNSVAPRSVVGSTSRGELVGTRSQPPVRSARQTALQSGQAGVAVATMLPTSASQVPTDPEPLSDRPEEPPPNVISRPTATVASLESHHEPAYASSPATLPSTEVNAVSAWSATADAGVAIGRGSQKAALATAGFFNRMGKKIAGSF